MAGGAGLKGRADYLNLIIAFLLALGLQAGLAVLFLHPPESGARDLGAGGLEVSITLVAATSAAAQSKAGDEAGKDIAERQEPVREEPPREEPDRAEKELPAPQPDIEERMIPEPVERVPEPESLPEVIPDAAKPEYEVTDEPAPDELAPNETVREDQVPDNLPAPQPVEEATAKTPARFPRPQNRPEKKRPMNAEPVQAAQQTVKNHPASSSVTEPRKAPPAKAAVSAPLPDAGKTHAASAQAPKGEQGRNDVNSEAREGLDGQATDAVNAMGGGAVLSSEDDYIRRIRMWLERHKSYSKKARRRRMQGVVQLYFRLDRNGQVLRREIRKGSGHSLLDKAVLAMLDRAQPLPSFPEELEGAYLDLVVPIDFSLRGNQ